jgi:hypothetical protein
MARNQYLFEGSLSVLVLFVSEIANGSATVWRRKKETTYRAHLRTRYFLPLARILHSISQLEMPVDEG